MTNHAPSRLTRNATIMSANALAPWIMPEHSWSSVRSLAQALGDFLPRLSRLSARLHNSINPDTTTHLPNGISPQDAIRFRQQHLQAATRLVEQLLKGCTPHRTPTKLLVALNHLQQGAAATTTHSQARQDLSPREIRKVIGGKKKFFRPSMAGLKYLQELQAFEKAGRLGLPPPATNTHTHLRLALAAYIRGASRHSTPQHSTPTLRELDKLLFDEWLNGLHQQDWKPLEQRHGLIFACGENTTEQHQFISHHTPAAHLSPTLRAAYAETGVKGICSYAKREARHAVNLWRTVFQVMDESHPQTLFSGIRHGVHDAYGLRHTPNKRVQANDVRVREFVQACLVDRLDKQALTPDEIASGVIDLPILSVNLLTPLGQEKNMLEHQLRAFEGVQKTGMSVELDSGSGQRQTMLIKPNFLCFSVPVNGLALNPNAQFLGIWRTADAINQRGITALQQEVKQHLDHYGRQIEYLDALEHPSDVEMRLRADLMRKVAWINTLVEQVHTIIQTQSHHVVGKEPYKLAVRLLALANECGITPAFNCKSGKDRTGQLSVEIREFYAASRATGRPRAVDTERTDWARANYQTLFTEGGDRIIQALNTGVPGSKAQLPYYNTMLGVAPKTMDAIKGLSKWVGT